MPSFFTTLAFMLGVTSIAANDPGSTPLVREVASDPREGASDFDSAALEAREATRGRAHGQADKLVASVVVDSHGHATSVESTTVSQLKEENPAMLVASELHMTSGCLGAESHKQQLRGEVLNSICENLGSANFLVFGTGYDSPFWLESNPKGKTRFLERHAEWVGFQPDQVQKAETMVNYTSKMTTAMKDINNTAMLREFFDKQLPSDVKATKWNVILVDSPEGFGTKNPGRGQSIFAASLLAGPSTVIFVDDCLRPVEDAYIRAYLVKNDRTLTRLDDGHGGTACRISAEES